MFVCQVSQWYDLVVFTASMEIYGAAVAEKLDRNRGILKRRYYRQVDNPVRFHVGCVFGCGDGGGCHVGNGGGGGDCSCGI